jgi:hypothetical protein
MKGWSDLVHLALMEIPRLYFKNEFPLDLVAIHGVFVGEPDRFDIRTCCEFAKGSSFARSQFYSIISLRGVVPLVEKGLALLDLMVWTKVLCRSQEIVVSKHGLGCIRAIDD